MGSGVLGVQRVRPKDDVVSEPTRGPEAAVGRRARRDAQLRRWPARPARPVHAEGGARVRRPLPRHLGAARRSRTGTRQCARGGCVGRAVGRVEAERDAVATELDRYGLPERRRLWTGLRHIDNNRRRCVRRHENPHVWIPGQRSRLEARVAELERERDETRAATPGRPGGGRSVTESAVAVEAFWNEVIDVDAWLDEGVVRDDGNQYLAQDLAARREDRRGDRRGIVDLILATDRTSQGHRTEARRRIQRWRRETGLVRRYLLLRVSRRRPRHEPVRTRRVSCSGRSRAGPDDNASGGQARALRGSAARDGRKGRAWRRGDVERIRWRCSLRWASGTRIMRRAGGGHGEDAISQVFRLRDRVRDGEYVRQLRCPGCGEWADLDATSTLAASRSGTTSPGAATTRHATSPT